MTPLELTAAYVPFANGGYRPEVHFIQRVTTADGKVTLRTEVEDASPGTVEPHLRVFEVALREAQRVVVPDAKAAGKGG